jgi:DNA-binding NarL/FixJ family response regulator
MRVLLVEDHTAFRQALALTLAREPDIVATHQAGTLAEARPQLRDADVGVFDIDLPDGNGIALIRELHAANPGAQALVLTASANQLDLAQAVESGAAGILHKSAPLAQIISAVRRLCDGELLLTPAELGELLRIARQQQAERREAQRTIDRLTPRELDVLRALARGLSDKEIAAELHISKDTVHTHMVNLLGKLGVESRLQALIFAVRHRIVELT